MNKVEVLQSLDFNQLTTPPKPKSWSIIEIIEHLNIAYEIYVDRIDTTLANLPTTITDDTSFKARPWQRFVIEGARPKNNKRKWKIKTLKKFVPVLDLKNLDDSHLTRVFERFKELHLHLKNSILASRSKNVTQLKINSGIGPIVNFYLPESFEFLIVHLERHMIQIEELLA